MGRLIYYAWIILASSANAAHAGTHTGYSVPTAVEMHESGALVFGAWGDLLNCGQADQVFITASYDQFKGMLSMALTAVSAGLEVKFYVSGCTEVIFYYGADPVFNKASHLGVRIRK